MIADICTLKLKSINPLLKCQQQIITFFFFLKCKNVVNTQICTGSDVFLEENKLEKQAASGKNASSSSFRPSPEICHSFLSSLNKPGRGFLLFSLSLSTDYLFLSITFTLHFSYFVELRFSDSTKLTSVFRLVEKQN